MKAYVICCNDSIEAVALNKKLANKTLKKMKKENFKMSLFKLTKEQYDARRYWHLDEVELIKE